MRNFQGIFLQWKQAYREIFKSTLQFVIFKWLSHCFEETIGFDVKASFASRPLSHLIRWYNKTRWSNKRILIKGYSVPWDFSWIENYKLFFFFFFHWFEWIISYLIGSFWPIHGFCPLYHIVPTSVKHFTTSRLSRASDAVTFLISCSSSGISSPESLIKTAASACKTSAMLFSKCVGSMYLSP